MHVHVSETGLEVRQCRERHGGLSPVEYLNACGLFDVPTTAAHCVAVSEGDMDILREKNVTVASCPKSNLKLASGVCPAAGLIRHGVAVALGTDSVTSNNNLDMLEEARFFSLLQKNHSGDPAALSPAETLRAASRTGALAQGRDDCGLIAPGYRADLAVLDVSGVHWQPVHDLMNNLIYSGSGCDVCMTVADGRVLYENGSWPTLDMDEILRQTEKSRLRILSEL
jgi:5-methylthioadenosine/S-adenosylhomocysteine deaminase